MSDIFISYASEDREKARQLAEVLNQQGWSVFWDRIIPTGKTFHLVIEEELDSARCVIVLWSKVAVTSDWVIAEAEEGRKRKVMLPTMLEQVKVPLAFRLIQASDLSGWHGENSHPELEKLVGDVGGLIGATDESGLGPALENTPSSKRSVNTVGGHSSSNQEQLAAVAGPTKRETALEDERARLDLTKIAFGYRVLLTLGISVMLLSGYLLWTGFFDGLLESGVPPAPTVLPSEPIGTREVPTEEGIESGSDRSLQERMVGMTVAERVKTIIVDQLSVSDGDVTPGAHFVDDLGADSLDAVELVMRFEEDFDMEIPDEEAEGIITVQDAIDYIGARQ